MVMSVLASVAGAVAAKGVSKLFGDDKKGGREVQSAIDSAKAGSTTGFTGGGLKGTFDKKGGRYVVGASTGRQKVTSGIAKTFADEALNYAKLREGVRPGMSGLRTSRLRELDNARTRSIGNLRDNLARRRVLGSSFAEDAITRAETEFGEAAGKIRAESFLQEIDLSAQLIGKQLEASRNAFDTRLKELNLQSEMAAKMAGMASGALSSLGQTQMELAAKSAAGRGKFMGDLLQPVMGSVGTGVKDALSGFFGSGGSGDVGLGSWAPV